LSSDIPANTITFFPNLLYLDCGNNKTVDDKHMKLLENLVTLHCGMSFIPDDGIKCLHNLRELYCDFNTRLSDKAVIDLENLIIFDCGRCSNFTDYGVKKLYNLQHLDCGFSLNFSDECLENLTELRVLKCGGNIFTDEGISKMNKLTYLDCGWSRNITETSLLSLLHLNVLVCNHFTPPVEKLFENLSELCVIFCSQKNVQYNVACVSSFNENKNTIITKNQISTTVLKSDIVVYYCPGILPLHKKNYLCALKKIKC
jgi:Leucine-rich repeat (LRR) protein